MGKIYGLALCLFSMFLVQSCSKNPSVESLIAKDPLAVVYLKSMKELKASLPAQAMMAVSMAEGAAVGMDSEKPAVLVLTGLNPVTAYAVLPMKDIAKKDAMTASMPENIKSGVVAKGNNLLIPIYGSLPTEFEPYSSLKPESIIQISSDLDLLDKKYGAYIRKQIKDGLSTISELGSEKEVKMLQALSGFYEDLIDQYLKNSQSLNIEYSKGEFITVDGSLTFKEGSKFAKASDALGKYKLPELKGLESGAVYYSTVMDWKEVEPLFGNFIETMGPFYKEMGINMDLRKFMDMFKKVGKTEMVGSMNLDMAENKMAMNYILRAEEGVLMNTIMQEIFTDFAKAENNDLLKISKEPYQFNGNPVYRFGYGVINVPATPQLNAVVGGDQSGFYFASSKEEIESLSKMKLSKSTQNGYMLMAINYSKLMPPGQGIPPMNFILKMLFSGKDGAMTFKLTFE